MDPQLAAEEKWGIAGFEERKANDAHAEYSVERRMSWIKPRTTPPKKVIWHNLRRGAARGSLICST
jgi:hypothetical protein